MSILVPTEWKKADSDFIVLVRVGFVSLAGKAILRLKNKLFYSNSCAFLDSWLFKQQPFSCVQGPYPKQ